MHIYTIMIVCFMAGALSLRAQFAIDTPSTTLASYCFELEKGNVEGAKAFTASFIGMPDEYVQEYTQKYAEAAKAGKLKLKAVPGSAKTLEDCAVVIVEEGERAHPDYDPAYLIKQKGAWRVLLMLTKWNDTAFVISDEQAKRFGELEAWAEAEMERLYGR